MLGLARRITTAAMLAAVAAASMGCELIAQVDRSKIPGDDGGIGGGGTGGGDGGGQDVCGDGKVTGAEKCDDGNTKAGDGCDATCQVETGWTCSSASPSVCAPTCGDGKVTGSEKCDDGNTTAGDGCSATCTVEPGFSCDTAMPSKCTPGCGDGVIAGSEKCDDGNTKAGDGCDATCQPEAGWTCTGMPSACVTKCGDGVVAGVETCDDGNTKAGDGCDATCQPESGWTCTGMPSACVTKCGDGVVAGAETCDDGNTKAGDGCDASCAAEAGWTCTGMPSACVTKCGDGVVAGVEKCDDGNTKALDGCDATCQPESGWTCTGMPSTCATTCGDGIKAGLEACDDGNQVNLDGCNTACKIDVFNETEPNDVPGQANGPFGYDVLIHGAVKPGTDSDWFAIQVPATADLTLSTFDGKGPGSCDNIDTVLTFYGSDGKTVLATDDDHGIGRCAQLTSPRDAALRHLPAGTYYAVVTAYAGYQPIPAYTLEIKFDALCGDGKKSGFEQCDGTAGCAATCDRVQKCGDGFIDGTEKCDDGNAVSGDGCSSTCQWEILAEAEPNDTPAQATGPHAAGVLYSGAISPATDVDYYAITVPATADLRIETFDATGPKSCNAIDTVVTLYGTDGTTVLITRDQGGVGNCSRIDPALPSDKAAAHLPAGKYYVEVQSHAGATTIAGYTLLVSYAALCGNGVIEGSEECDGTAGCTATCTRTPVCGDGFVDAPETCDDGNTTSGDGCSATCKVELVNETEANDTSATANGPFSTHTLIQGAISPGTDLDFFAVSLASVSDVRIQTFDGNGPGTCADVDTVITFYAADGTTVLATNDDGGNLGSCSLLDPKVDAGVRHLAAGTYFVKVEDFKNNNAIPAYRLEISFPAVCGNGKIEGFEECDGSAGCDASCNRVPTCGDGYIDGSETCDDGNTTAGDGCSTTCQLESIAEVEPNDTTANADAATVQLSGAATVSGAIGAVGDKDFFKLTLAAGGTYRFETLDPSGADCTIATTVRLWDSGGAQLQSDDNSGISSCSALTLNLAAGTYYVSVEQQGNTAAIPGYLLAIRAEADGGAEAEPNDTATQATAVTGVEVFAVGDHQVNTDTDFFAINVPAGKSVRAELIEGNSAKTCDSLGIDSFVTLYDAKGLAIAGDDDGGRGFCSLIDGTGSAPVNAGAHALAGGVYYLAVEASPFSQAPTNPDGQFVYRLVVTIR